MNKIDIREIQKEDTKIFRELRLEALKDSPDSFGQKYSDQEKKPLEYWQNLIAEVSIPHKNRIFLAFKENSPIGMIFCFIKKENENLGSLGGMWVKPEFRKQGIASQLIKTAINWAKENQLKKITLWNTENNTASKNLYEKFGFTKNGNQRPLDSNPKLTINQYELDT